MDNLKNTTKAVQLLPLSEKAALTTGIDEWRLYIPSSLKGCSFRVSDGPLGIREENDKGETYQAVCFPSPSCLASSFDLNLVYDINKEIGEEAKNRGISCMLSPGINLKRNPLCGRNFEYFSEDPVLSGKMGSAAIRGLESVGISSCLKHYLANSQEYGRYTVSSNIDDKALNELYLKNFMIAITEGKPKAIMSSYNRVNHVYVNESKELLSIPREKWGFDGIYFSDWNAVVSRKRSLLAGTDLEMPHSLRILDTIKASPNDSEIQKALNASDIRLYDYISKFSVSGNKEIKRINKGHDLAAYAVANSIILLKNELKMLPLKAEEKLAVIGSLTKNPCYEGSGSAKVESDHIDDLLNEIKKYGRHVSYADGYNANGWSNLKLTKEAVDIAKSADKVLFVVGSLPFNETEFVDRTSMRLPGDMGKLFEAIYAVNPKIVLLIETGSPLEIPFKDHASAILLSYMGGEAMGRGIAYSLYGIVSPSGRLPETWPISYADTPCANNYTKDLKDQYFTESIYVGYRYYEKINQPVAFPFGFGLSYSNFHIESLKMTKKKDGLLFKIVIKNTGEYDASTPILLYSSKPTTDTFRPARELVGFSKIYLFKGKSGTKEIFVPYEYLKVYDFKKGMVLESGTYFFDLGFSSNDLSERKTYLVDNGVMIADEIRYTAKSYFLFTDNSFPVSLFERLYIKPLVDDPLTFVDWNSTIDDFGISLQGARIKDAILEKLDMLPIEEKKKAFVKAALSLSPLRISYNIVPLYTKEEFDKIFDIVNGKNTNYRDFLTMKGAQ